MRIGDKKTCKTMMAQNHRKIKKKKKFPSISAFQARVQRFAVVKLGCTRLDAWGEQRVVSSSLSKVSYSASDLPGTDFCLGGYC